MNQMAIYYVNM